MPEPLPPTPHHLTLHWRHTRRLTLWLLLIWFATTFCVVFFARQLATLQVFGWPVSFYMAAQGSILIYVLIVVSVGGLGSIGGSFAAAVLIGISDVAGKYYVPELGSFLIYLVMIVLLMWRPAGLFGRR